MSYPLPLLFASVSSYPLFIFLVQCEEEYVFPFPPPFFLFLPHNYSHIFLCHLGSSRQRRSEGGGLWTIFLHSVLHPLDLLSPPPPPILLISCPPNQLLLGISYVLIPHTVPQNLPHYCNFFIFVLLNVFLNLDTFSIGGVGW